jgi:uncharacterized membrane protein YecN with MAPEG domain
MSALMTTFYAGLLGLLFLLLSGRIMFWRFRTGVLFGDEDKSKLGMIRAHANFFEFVPIALVLLLLFELSGGEPQWVHAFGAMLLLARVLHAVGLSITLETSFGRRAGAGLTMVMLAGVSIACVMAGLAELIQLS